MALDRNARQRRPRLLSANCERFSKLAAGCARFAIGAHQFVRNHLDLREWEDAREPAAPYGPVGGRSPTCQLNEFHERNSGRARRPANEQRRLSVARRRPTLKFDEAVRAHKRASNMIARARPPRPGLSLDQSGQRADGRGRPHASVRDSHRVSFAERGQEAGLANRRRLDTRQGNQLGRSTAPDGRGGQRRLETSAEK